MRTLTFLALTASFLSVSAVYAEDGIPETVRKSLDDRLIGEWSTETKLGDDASKGTYVAKWSPGKQSIRIQMRSTGDDGTSHASELMGWDADAKSLVTYGFGPDSANWTLRFKEISSKVWKGEWKGFINGNADGSSFTMELRGDSFEYRDTTDGKSLVIKAVRK